MKRKLITLFVLLALLMTGLPVQPARAGGSTMFVDADSNCVSSCGGSWATAYPTLQTALEGAAIGAVYWVAEGVYYPDEGSNQVNNSRTSTYTLMKGVEIYGGFNGTETLLSQRNISANPTILSGDIDKNDVNTDGDFIADTVTDIVGNNAYHVVTGSGTDNTAILDGFTVTAGLANGTSPHDQGGGVYNSGGNPEFSNTFFLANRASIGGGMRNINSSPILVDCSFLNNSADFGGGMANWNSAPTFSGARFKNNVATSSGPNTGLGGGIHNWNSAPNFYSFNFSGNNAAKSGGGMYNGGSSAPTMSYGGFTYNNANTGGGIANVESNPVLMGIYFFDNHAVNGGGIANDASQATISNVTLSQNIAENGGGIFNTNNSSPVLTHVTFANNKASSQGGGMLNSSGTPTLINTLIANSAGGGDCKSASSLNSASTHNLIEDSVNDCGLTDGVNGNIIGLDPKLGLLEDISYTHRLLANSPAIDSGDKASCLATDQRNISRPQGPNCDIGSYELEQSSVVFRSTAANDGWILESGENTSKGGTKDNQATVFRLGDGEADKQYRAILSFNTDSLPDGAIITQVIVKIKEQGLSGTNPFTILGGLKVDMQKPFFGATLGLTIADFEAAAGKNAVATFGATATDSWYSAVLNAAGKAFVNKTGVTQFRLRFATADDDDNAANYMKFFSGNHSVAANRPTLVINYYVP